MFQSRRSLRYPPTHSCSLVTNNTIRWLSSNDAGMSYNPMDWWKDRQSKKEKEKFKERTISMANSETWTLGHMSEELEEATGWKSKIPGMSGTKEVKAAKEMKGIIDAFIDLLGKDATDKDLEVLRKIEKLRIANQVDAPLQTVNMVIDQMANMCVVQKVLRNRQKAGKKLPETQENLVFVVQNEGLQHMSGRLKEKMMKMAGNNFKSLGR